MTSFFYGGVSASALKSPPVVSVPEAKQPVDRVSAVSELQACATSAVGCSAASPAVVLAMGRKSRSQKTGRGPQDRVFSLSTPISWKLPRTDNQSYKFNDRFLVATLTSQVASNTYAAYLFSVNSMGNIAALQGIFDQYRILKIHVMTFPETNLVAAGATATAGMLHTVIDYDDGTVLASEQAALDYQNVLSSSFSDGHSRVFKPHAALAAYQGTFAGYCNVASPWIDAAYPSVQHFGLKVVVTAATVATNQQIYCTLFTEWRNVR
jgi:hypothetical protein